MHTYSLYVYLHTEKNMGKSFWLVPHATCDLAFKSRYRLPIVQFFPSIQSASTSIRPHISIIGG